MYIIYNLIVLLTEIALKVLAVFNPKLSLFVQGRKETGAILKAKIKKADKTIWIHAASLGEYEQGLPIIDQIKKDYPTHKIILSFFSPSGYEVKKESKVADAIVYLPLDSKSKVKQFLHATHPELAIFIKYEIWPNYLNELQKRNIPSVLISALFKKNQIYFKWYGGFMRRALTKFSFIFVQNESAEKLLQSININNVSVSGDTRFDRVLEITQGDNTLDFMDEFTQEQLCMVAGSTWPEDEKLLINYINKSSNDTKFVIAPHNIKENHIINLKNSIEKSVVLYSELKLNTLENSKVLILDTIGLLTKIYSYADIAYVGGGFATGLHNTLEPAVFGIPVLIGPKYKGFAEAEALVKNGGIISLKDEGEFFTTLQKLVNDKNHRIQLGDINRNHIENNQGASLKIMRKIVTLIK